MTLTARHLLAFVYMLLAEQAESFDALDNQLRAADPVSPESQERKRAAILAMGGVIGGN